MFLVKAKEIHGNKYDYSLTAYVASKKSVKIRCLTCNNVFEQIPNAHLTGRGCYNCKWNDKKHSFDKFVALAREKHGNLYEYTTYFGVNHKINIKCNNCQNFFEQTARAHLRGNGCPLCNNAGSSPLFAQNFIQRAKLVHGEKFDYSQSIYLHSQGKIQIRCKNCDLTFWQTPVGHLRGRGCWSCSFKKSSSDLENQWLDKLQIPYKCRQQVVFVNDKEHFVVDALVEQTIYEFNGSIWHGDPRRVSHDDFNPINHKSYKKLYENTIKRQKRLEQKGFTVKFVWEIDFNSGLNFSVAHPLEFK